MKDGNPLQVSETVVLDKWEGDVDEDTAFIAERVWVKDGKIIDSEQWDASTYIAPFDPKTDPTPTPPSQR